MAVALDVRQDREREDSGLTGAMSFGHAPLNEKRATRSPQSRVLDLNENIQAKVNQVYTAKR